MLLERPAANAIVKRKTKYPAGWNQARVKRVIAHYEGQSPVEAAAEDEASFSKPEETVISVPTDLVPEVKKLIARHKARRG